jgi:hypothetical protein
LITVTTKSAPVEAWARYDKAAKVYVSEEVLGMTLEHADVPGTVAA